MLFRSEPFFPGSGDDDPELPPFEFIDESPTPDTSIANLEIYTIYTGNFGDLDPDLKSIASTTGGTSLAAPTPDDLVTTLLTIINLPSINLAVSPTSVTEDATTNLVYTFNRTGDTTNALTVNYTVGGTASFNTDYTQSGAASFTATTGTVTFAAGLDTATVTIDPTADTIVEPDETVTLTLASGTGYTISTTTEVTGTITNDDTIVALAVSPASVNEDGITNLVYTFTRTGDTTNALTVNYTVGGAANFNTDYTQSGAASFTSTTGTVNFAAGLNTATVEIDPTADTTFESDESVALTLTSGTGYTVGTTTSVTGTIVNDDTSVTLAVSPGSVTEDGTTNLVYTFTRTGVTNNALTVNYTVGGTATNGTDYAAIPTSVTFDANSSTATVTIDPTADSIVEPDETVDLTLTPGTGYTIGTTTAVTGAILNDDVTVSTNTPLFRFQKTSVPGAYLFAGEEEAVNIRENYKDFREEGFAFGVATSQTDPLLQPFYRFQNTSIPGAYLYVGAEEAANIRQNYTNFQEEGLAFYAYGAGTGMGTTFYRLQNTDLPGTYLFAGPSETESILANYSNFRLEGIAFEAAG